MSRPKNDTFLRALLKEPTEYTPLWLMRQAGRYLPEYCETRKRAGNFLNLCKSPTMACEVTLQPLARYDLDAAILFSDILTVPDAMGLGLYFAEGEGPRFERPLREEWAINNLTAPDPYEHLGYVMDAVSEIRRALDNSVPLIGFSGSPYTLACYMVEGQGSSDFRNAARSILIAGRDPEHPEVRVVAHAKNSLGQPGESQRYRICPQGTVAYDGPCTLTADAIIREAGTPATGNGRPAGVAPSPRRSSATTSSSPSPWVSPGAAPSPTPPTSPGSCGSGTSRFFTAKTKPPRARISTTPCCARCCVRASWS